MAEIVAPVKAGDVIGVFCRGIKRGGALSAAKQSASAGR